MIANKTRPACPPLCLSKNPWCYSLLSEPSLFQISHISLKKILMCHTTLHRQFTFLNYESVRSDLHTLHSSWKYLSHTTTSFGHQNTSPEENKLRACFCMRNTSRVRKEKFKNKVGRTFLCSFHNGLCSTPRGDRK